LPGRTFGQLLRKAERIGACFIEPMLCLAVAAIEFLESTLDNCIRHPKFVTLPDDWSA
jgi:hypothetical protein